MIKKAIYLSGILTLSLIAWTSHSTGIPQTENKTTALPLKAAPGDAYKEKETDNEPTLLGEHHKRMLEVAQSLATSCTKVMEKWIRSNEVSEDVLFSYLYYPVEDSNPTKFNTDYDSFSDRDLQDVLEKHLIMVPDTIYSVMSDRNGYVPTHNLKYSKPLTGDIVKDLVDNRTKRIYADKTGLTASRNLEPYLLQSYKRDTGQIMVDLSVPLYIGERHWGAVRVGYLITE